MTSIGDYAFMDCKGLTEVTIPNGVTSIGEWAFYGCSGLTSITIGNSVTNIGEYAFYGCCNLQPVTIPNSVTSIGEYAFSGCDRTWWVWGSGETIVRLMDGTLTVSGEGAMADYDDWSPWFYDLYGSITSIIIEDGVTSIGDRAFRGLSALTEVTIPNSVTSIGDYAFADCCNLLPVTIPSSVTSIGDWTFSGCPGRTWGVWQSGETIARFMDGTLTVSGEGAMADYDDWSPWYYGFYGTITSVIIEDGVTNIGKRAFFNSFALTEVTIPNSVTSIGESAFFYCESLTSITIPNSVTSIGDWAFEGCSNLASVTSWNTLPSNYGSYPFIGINADAVLYVPYNSLSAYINWGDNEWQEILPISYPITYHLNDGTQESGAWDSYNYGVVLTLPSAPKKAGYTFAGWYDNAELTGTAVTEISAANIGSMEFWAKWAISNYTVTYNGNGHTGGTVPTVQTSTYNTTVEVSDVGTLVRIGHTFAGWNTAANGSGTNYAVGAVYTIPAANTTLYAKWAINTYTVTFMDGTTELKKQVVNHGSAATAPAVDSVSHTVSWDKAFNNVTANLTVNAVWTLKTYYTVTFSAGANGSVSATVSGAAVTSPATVEQGKNVVFTAAPSEGYKVAAWTLNGTAVAGQTGVTYTLSSVGAASVVSVSFEKTSSIVSNDRNIPVTPDHDAAVIAPVNVSAFELTVGPNPVRKSDGVVNVFVTGKRIDKGELTIYDATGNVVRKITVADNAIIGNTERRVVGSWDLKDGKGNNVSAGAYLLRGTIKTIDGRREKVSVMVGVR